MSVTVRMNRVEEVELTPANEADLLSEEWERRYDDRPFVSGDGVRIIAPARQRHADALGGDYIGRRGIVTSQADADDVKVLFINKEGSFVEIWTPEACLEAAL